LIRAAFSAAGAAGPPMLCAALGDRQRRRRA
jgi:hypothetical protein